MLLKTKCITWKPKSPITRHSIILLYIPLLNKYFFLLIIIMIKIFFFFRASENNSGACAREQSPIAKII